MFLPYSTDAPIYHWPIATVSLILLNVVIFCGTTLQVMTGALEPEQIEWLIMLFNQINPAQWITGSFMHADPIHLIGNMIFLWAFGLVVEGKCGWWKFLIAYFAIIIGYGATVQIPMFFLTDGESGALGASGVIFGIMMMAMIWAPENEMDCVFMAGWYTRVVEIRLVALAGFFLAMQVFFFFLGGMGMSSEALHLAGIAWGTPIGFFMLRQDIIDCEGWDLVTRTDLLFESRVFCTDAQRARKRDQDDLKGDAVAVALGSKTASRHGMVVSSYHEKQAAKERAKAEAAAKTRSKKTKPPRPVAATVPPPPSTSTSTSHPEFNRQTFLLRQAITQGSVVAAAGPWSRLCQFDLARGVSPKTLWGYLELLQTNKRYPEMLSPLMALVRDQSVSSNRARLKIAQLQANLNKDRVAGIATLQSITGPVKPGQEDQTILSQRDQLLAKWSGSDQ